MKEMVTFFYLFKNETQLLTNDAAYHIVNRGLKYRGNEFGQHMEFRYSILWVSRT
jgi:hypothetical protein